MNNEEVIQDFRRRYQGTFVFLRMENKDIETLVKVDEVQDSSSKVGVLRLSSEEFGALTLNIGSSDHSLVFKSPPVGVFQHHNHAFLFQRRPVRQYQRGICSNNSYMASVTAKLTGNLSYWLDSEIKSAFNHKTFSLAEGLDLINKSKIPGSVALKDNFSISRSMFSSPEHVLWYWDHPVARCTSKGEVTKIYEDVMTSQLKELM